MEEISIKSQEFQKILGLSVAIPKSQPPFPTKWWGEKLLFAARRKESEGELIPVAWN